MNYTNFLNIERVEDKVAFLYETSYEILCKNIVETRLLGNNEILRMKFLFNEFVNIVQQQEGCDASNYKVHRLKMRLKKTYPQLVFHMPSRRVLGEIVFSENVNLRDIAEERICEDNDSSDTDTELIDREINLQSTSNAPNSDEKVPNSDDQFNIRSLYHTAMFLHEKIKECKPFYDSWPPSPSEICIKSAEKMVPPPLAAFLSWLLGFTTDVSINSCSSLPEKKYLKILSIAQDIIHVCSKGTKHTPKSISLGMAVRQITGSHQLTKILNGYGNSVSYSTVLSLDTALAAQNMDTTVTIPKGITSNKFTMLVWDNIDFQEETPSGAGTTHMGNGIIIQQIRPDEPLPPPAEQTSTVKKSCRSLKAPQEQLSPYILGRKESPKLYNKNGNVNINIDAYEEPILASQRQDFIYILCKHFCSNGTKLLPGWTGFNTITSSKPCSLSKVAYLPVVDAPVTELSTINAILKRSACIVDKLNLKYAVLIFDEALYSKAQQIRWKSEELLSKFIIRLGDFHACMSFASAIACRFREAGLQVLIVKSNLFKHQLL